MRIRPEKLSIGAPVVDVAASIRRRRSAVGCPAMIVAKVNEIAHVLRPEPGIRADGAEDAGVDRLSIGSALIAHVKLSHMPREKEARVRPIELIDALDILGILELEEMQEGVGIGAIELMDILDLEILELVEVQ